ncbi:MAG: antitoxin Xre/MbcA/ParS toxin-binding domain-containing protein [Pseudomonadota bacterium]
MNDKQQAALGDITRMVMAMLDSWKLETAEMQAILCLPTDVRARAFKKFREGQAVFPDDPKVLRRARYLLRISDALRTTYPRNPEMAGRWIRQRHRRFGRRTPLSIILNDGESGLIAVLSELDCTFSWDLTGSQPHRPPMAG